MVRSTLHTLALASLVACSGCAALRQDPEDRAGSGYETPPEGWDAGGRTDLTVVLGPSDLQIDPGNSRTIEIQVLPEGTYDVTLAILGEGSAFLDRDRLTTNADGRASALLTVPSENPGLTVLASVGRSTGELSVSVGRAVADVVVTPLYSGGREVDEWIVRVLHDGTACPDETRFEAEGELFGLGDVIHFAEVPAAQPVQIFVRGGEYTFGCAANVTLRPGLENVISVQVSDRPIQLAGLDMAFVLGFDRTPEIEGALGTIATQMVSAFSAGLESDSAGLLYAMAEVYEVRAPGYGRSRFDVAAQERRFDEAVEEHLAARSSVANPLSETVQRWLAGGIAQVFAEEGFLRGALVADAAPDVSTAQVTLWDIGPIAPRDAEIASQLEAPLTTTADQVSVEPMLAVRPSKLLAALGKWAGSIGALSDVPVALADVVDCTALGEELLALSEDQLEPLPECPPSCLSQLCNDGLAWMWAQAEQAALSERMLTIGALGDATIDGQARPLELNGTWAGQINLIDGADAVHAGGDFRAAPEE